jgi:hypothetical protein
MGEILGERINDWLEWRTYNNTSIIFGDYRGLSGEAYPYAIRQITQDLADIGRLRGEKSLLFFCDISDSTIDTAAVDAFKNGAADLTTYTKACAVVGVAGVRKFLLDVVTTFSGMNIKAFSDNEKALEWLTSQ